LLVPVGLIVAVLGSASIDWYYERVPEGRDERELQGVQGKWMLYAAR
jgi:hypothetical protein